MNKYRTHNCSELTENEIGKDVKLSGWLHRKRDHGNLLFIDLRDHYGLTQCVIENNNRYKHDAEVSLGSEKWVSIKSYNKSKNNSIDACNMLKSDGYQIIATTPHNADCNLFLLIFFTTSAGVEIFSLLIEIIRSFTFNPPFSAGPFGIKYLIMAPSSV